ncbi:hypothetical protein X992_4882 [Burkholderia pseudomallei MSHR5492]|nr:hypothetical protein X992_4882 [Burkholderia pseudomallei MSHR5492]
MACNDWGAPSRCSAECRAECLFRPLLIPPNPSKPRTGPDRAGADDMLESPSFPLRLHLPACRYPSPYPDSCAIAAQFERKPTSAPTACGTSKPA